MDLERLYSTLYSVWVVLFFVLFVGIVAWIMRPSKRKQYEQAGKIPFRDDPAAGDRSN